MTSFVNAAYPNAEFDNGRGLETDKKWFRNTWTAFTSPGAYARAREEKGSG